MIGRFIFLLLLSLSPFSFLQVLQAQSILDKSVEVGKTFSIIIYSEMANEKFKIGDITSPIISNILDERKSDKHIFRFLSLSPGQTKLVIKKIHFNYIIDDYLIYHITIKEKMSKKVKTLKPRKPKNQNEQANLEKSRFELINELYFTTLFSQALKEIKNFNRQFPKSRHSFFITIIHSDILEKQNQLKEAHLLISRFLNKNKKLSTDKKAELYQIAARLKGKMDQNEEAITLLLKAKSLPNISVPNLEKLNYKLANYYLKEKKYPTALLYYEKVYSNHIYKKRKYKLDIYQEALMEMAKVLEISQETRNLERAYKIYDEFISIYPQSSFVKQAKKKKKLLKQNFIDPR